MDSSSSDLILRLPDGHVSRLRFKPKQTLRRVLKVKCRKRGIDYNAFEATDKDGNVLDDKKTLGELGVKRVRFTKPKHLYSTVQGLEKGLYLPNKDMNVVIQPKDKNGNNVVDVFMVDVIFMVRGPEPVTVDLKKEEDGKFVATWKASTTGKYHICIIVSGIAAKGYPFTISIVRDRRTQLRASKSLTASSINTKQVNVTRKRSAMQSDDDGDDVSISLSDEDVLAEPPKATAENLEIPEWVKEVGYDEATYKLERINKGWPEIFIATSYVVIKAPTKCTLLYKIVKSNPQCVHYKNPQGSTPLHIAAHYENEEVVEFLLGYKANGNVKNKWGDTPFSIAIDKRNSKILRIFESYNFKAPRIKKSTGQSLKASRRLKKRKSDSSYKNRRKTTHSPRARFQDDKSM